MNVSPRIKTGLQHTADLFYRVWPQPLPPRGQLDRCKIISHRGEHDNRTVRENSLPAFDKARDQGVWGIELDVRWSKDLHPIVFHDRNMKRLFQSNQIVDRLTLSEIEKTYATIPSLAEVIDRYGKSLHLMIELKEEICPNPDYQSRVLEDLLGPLKPIIDYHFISLQPEMFKQVGFVSPKACIPVAEFNIDEFSAAALENEYGGITGHYLMLTADYIEKHKSVGQKVGTGFISSRYCLYRELNRGIDWIFTNQASKLQSIIRKSLT